MTKVEVSEQFLNMGAPWGFALIS